MTDTLTVEAINLEEPIASTPRSLSEKEQAWAQFIRDLQPWELHKLHVVGELDLHDDFVSGKRSLMDVFAEVCIKGEEGSYSKKV